MKLIKELVVVGYVLLLVGCGSAGISGDDNTGDLGAVQENSPADVYVKMGVEYMRFGKYSTALQKLKKGLEVDPRNAQLHNVLGIVYQNLGENDQARTHFKRALRLASEDPFIHNAYGSFLCQQNEYDDAIDQFENSVKNPLNPAPWVSLTNAGLCALDMKKNTVAEDYFRRALQANPVFETALKSMMIVKYREGRMLPARAYLQRYEQRAKHTSESLYYAYLIEKKLGKIRKSTDYSRQLTTQYPDSRESLLLERGIEE